MLFLGECFRRINNWVEETLVNVGSLRRCLRRPRASKKLVSQDRSAITDPRIDRFLAFLPTREERTGSKHVDTRVDNMKLVCNLRAACPETNVDGVLSSNSRDIRAASRINGDFVEIAVQMILRQFFFFIFCFTMYDALGICNNCFHFAI